MIYSHVINQGDKDAGSPAAIMSGHWLKQYDHH